MNAQGHSIWTNLPVDQHLKARVDCLALEPDGCVIVALGVPGGFVTAEAVGAHDCNGFEAEVGWCPLGGGHLAEVEVEAHAEADVPVFAAGTSVGVSTVELEATALHVAAGGVVISRTSVETRGDVLQIQRGSGHFTLNDTADRIRIWNVS